MSNRLLFLRSITPLLVLLLFPILLLWKVVFLGEAFLPADLLKDLLPWGHVGVAAVPWDPLMWDGIGQFYPWRLFAAQTEQGGFLPLWNPHQFCGAPFAANSQSAIYYPFNILFAVLPIKSAFGASVLVHLFLTGVFLYRFLRTAFDLGRGPALAGAVTWQLCTWQVSWLELPTFLCVSAWIPASLLLVYRLSRWPTPFTTASLGATLGLMLLAGHLQICLYGFVLIAAYGAYRLLPLLAPRLFRVEASSILRNRLIAGVLVSCAIGMLLGLAQLLPTVELSRMSHRTGGRATWHGYRSYIADGAMPVFQLVTLAVPDFFGNPTEGDYWGYDSGFAENACYIGIVGLLMAIIGTVATWRYNTQTRFFVVAGVVSVLMALGTPLNTLFYFGIPGFAESGSPTRILVVWSLCCAVLTGVGTQRILEKRLDSIKPAVIAAIVAVLLIPIGAFLHLLWFIWSQKDTVINVSQNLSNEPNLWRAPVVILLAAGLSIGLFRQGRISRHAAVGILVAVMGLDLLVAGVNYNRSTAPSNVYPVTPAIAYLQQNAGTDRTIPVNSNWSIQESEPPAAVLPPNTAMAYGLYDTQGYDSLFPGQYMSFVANANGDGRSPAPDENGNIVFTRGRLSDAARELAGAYVLVMSNLQPPQGEPKIRRLLADGDSSLLYNGYAEPHFQLIPSGAPAQADYPAPTRVDITVPQATRGPTGVIVRDEWYPGWQANVDGHGMPIQEGPYVFRTLSWEVLPGRRQPAHVEMRFQPATTFLGIYCLVLGWALAIGLLSCAWIRHPRAIRP